ncbi:uncharacterized protein SCHCODRAFT_02664041 [Schizophyllum commune H4-8]|nr:uncharacterized protein SCHCODRAFT_02664041 [Schizophyllum commune H4-8]KAI5896199.1 hypothetical protein SCHCODRAFT_02664041 [Schizophyllum commune H4-8]
MSSILSSPSSPHPIRLSSEAVEQRCATTACQDNNSDLGVVDGASETQGGNAANPHNVHFSPGQTAIPSGVVLPHSVTGGHDGVPSSEVTMASDVPLTAEGVPIPLAPDRTALPQDTVSALEQGTIPADVILSPRQAEVLPAGEAPLPLASGQARVSDDAVLVPSKEALPDAAPPSLRQATPPLGAMSALRQARAVTDAVSSGETTSTPVVPVPADKAPTALTPNQDAVPRDAIDLTGDLPRDGPARFRELPAARDAVAPSSPAEGGEFAVGMPHTIQGGVDLQRIIKPFCDHVQGTVSRLQEEIVRADCNCSQRSNENLVALQELDKRMRSLESRAIGAVDGARPNAGAEEQASSPDEGPASARRKRARSVSSQDDEGDADRIRRRNADGTAVALRAPVHAQDVAGGGGEFSGEGGGFRFKFKWGFKGFNG